MRFGKKSQVLRKPFTVIIYSGIRTFEKIKSKKVDKHLPMVYTINTICGRVVESVDTTDLKSVARKKV